MDTEGITLLWTLALVTARLRNRSRALERAPNRASCGTAPPAGRGPRRRSESESSNSPTRSEVREGFVRCPKWLTESAVGNPGPRYRQLDIYVKRRANRRPAGQNRDSKIHHQSSQLTKGTVGPRATWSPPRQVGRLSRPRRGSPKRENLRMLFAHDR